MTKGEKRIDRCGWVSGVLLVFLGAAAGYVGVLMMIDPGGEKFELTKTVAAGSGLQSLFWIGLPVFCVDCILSGAVVWLLIGNSRLHKDKPLYLSVILAASCAALLYTGVGGVFYQYICMPASGLLVLSGITAYFSKTQPKLI